MVGDGDSDQGECRRPRVLYSDHVQSVIQTVKGRSLKNSSLFLHTPSPLFSFLSSCRITVLYGLVKTRWSSHPLRPGIRIEDPGAKQRDILSTWKWQGWSVSIDLRSPHFLSHRSVIPYTGRTPWTPVGRHPHPTTEWFSDPKGLRPVREWFVTFVSLPPRAGDTSDGPTGSRRGIPPSPRVPRGLRRLVVTFVCPPPLLSFLYKDLRRSGVVRRLRGYSGPRPLAV